MSQKIVKIRIKCYRLVVIGSLNYYKRGRGTTCNSSNEQIVQKVQTAVVQLLDHIF